MSSSSRIRLVARREFVERVRTRAFAIVAVIVALGSFAGLALPHALRGEPKPVRIGLVGSSPPALAAALRQTGRSVGEAVAVVPIARERNDRSLQRGAVDAVLVDGTHAMIRQDASTSLPQLIQAAVRQQRLARVLAAASVTPAQLRAVNAPFPIDKLGKTSSTADRIMAIIVLAVLYALLLLGGNLVATSVVEEKASKLVEVVVPAVRPTELLAGKVAGVGAVGLCQLGCAVAGCVAATLVQGSLKIPHTAAGVGLISIAWILIGYAFYAAAFAAAAALVSRQEDVATVTAPLSLVIGLGYLVALVALRQPAGSLTHLLSFIPPLAPLVMPTRVAVTGVAAWEQGIAMLLALAATVLLVRLAGRLYAGALLAEGGRLRVFDALRRAREERRVGRAAIAERTL
jgi:ABC-2 type transport system permease protein